ncbi:uncharacterized protein LOC110185574 [Drosophila serrata]|uniref:uncharacterized protein LOC110185574 n=1 Tax=Drosophila serrata TaxID=7274 RepID=UPI000A1CF560|nr:uncharacterized protein LOC110185574 [Drosophila serrata]
MKRQRIIYTDIALVSKAMRAMGKPVTVKEIADYMVKLLGLTGNGLEIDIQLLLENYQPLGYFKRKGDLYSIPSEILAIMKDLDSEKKQGIVTPEKGAAEPQESNEVYAYASHIDISKSLTHPYYYRFN